MEEDHADSLNFIIMLFLLTDSLLTCGYHGCVMCIYPMQLAALLACEAQDYDTWNLQECFLLILTSKMDG